MVFTEWMKSVYSSKFSPVSSLFSSISCAVSVAGAVDREAWASAVMAHFLAVFGGGFLEGNPTILFLLWKSCLIPLLCFSIQLSSFLLDYFALRNRNEISDYRYTTLLLLIKDWTYVLNAKMENAQLNFPHQTPPQTCSEDQLTSMLASLPHTWGTSPFCHRAVHSTKTE